MFTLPIIAFYVGLYFVFPHKEEPLMWSGGLAVIFANVVIAGYVVSAFSEEDEITDGHHKQQQQQQQQQQKGDGKSGDGDAAYPRVGVFKQRTD
ncbi:hypothetical protein ACHAWU_009981 [Discostella pseudostelligera]|uniref:Vacuolar ATPase assembly integral membrane protein VMA21 homolog n=1 Tax=Discostella pseudostelligera TaxID=259834 RepID=A0ABD3MAX4_9STRA